MNTHKIQPLSSEVVAKIKSSTSITHLNGVIAELVKNSLDANAQSIFVTVDYRRGGCVVEDDGDGILPAEFAPDGGLGKIHLTYTLFIERFYANLRRYLQIAVAITRTWPKGLLFGIVVCARAADNYVASSPQC
jgi:hypothetical protein